LKVALSTFDTSVKHSLCYHPIATRLTESTTLTQPTADGLQLAGEQRVHDITWLAIGSNRTTAQRDVVRMVLHTTASEAAATLQVQARTWIHAGSDRERRTCMEGQHVPNDVVSALPPSMALPGLG